MSDEYLDSISEATQEIISVAYELKRLGGAFGATGNGLMQDTLFDMSNELLTSQENISGAVGKEINRSLSRAQQGVGDTISLLLEASTKSIEILDD